MRNFHIATLRIIGLSIVAHSGDTMSHQRWCCGPGNCHLQLHSGSANPERLACILFLCVHAWDTPGTNFVIFQCFQHYFQCSESGIQLYTKLPACKALIWVDELNKVPFTSLADSCAGLPGMWPYLASLSSLLRCITHCLTELTSMVWSLYKCSERIDECQWM
jgi:hypothetical protein